MSPDVAYEQQVGRVAANYDASVEDEPFGDAPDAPNEAVYRGVLGELVMAIAPHSEADPVALLVQLLVAVGNAIGRSPTFVHEDDTHHANLFCLIIGGTASGKGTSWGRVRAIMRTIDDTWTTRRIKSGIVSGEGVVHEVRDGSPEANNGKGDPGVTDKRLLILETEFGGPLKVLSRDGNTSSAVLRQAWDWGELRTMAKNSGEIASNAHISLIGHITPYELRRRLDTTEVANGLLNRFLLVYAKRSKLLPEGGTLTPDEIIPLLARLRGAVSWAREATRLQRDAHARELWASVYGRLTAGRPGRLGNVTSRAKAQVTRLAMLYAVLDGVRWITASHLESALALWAYCEQSAAFILGRTLGDPLAERIYELLEQRPNGMSRNDIRDAFKRNRSADEIAAAISVLEEQGLLSSEKKPPDTGRGRPRTVFRIHTAFTAFKNGPSFSHGNGKAPTPSHSYSNTENKNAGNAISPIPSSSLTNSLINEKENREIGPNAVKMTDDLPATNRVAGTPLIAGNVDDEAEFERTEEQLGKRISDQQDEDQDS